MYLVETLEVVYDVSLHLSSNMWTDKSVSVLTRFLFFIYLSLLMYRHEQALLLFLTNKLCWAASGWVCAYLPSLSALDKLDLAKNFDTPLIVIHVYFPSFSVHT